MSCQEWHVKGYGFQVDELLEYNENDMKKVITLIEKSPKTMEKVLEKWEKKMLNEYNVSNIYDKEKHSISEEFANFINQNPNMSEELLDCLEGDYFDEVGPGYLLKLAIKENENIEMTCAKDENNNTFLLFEPGYPWSNSSETEKSLTEEKLKEILTEYIRIFTDKEVDIDYFTAVNFG